MSEKNITFFSSESVTEGHPDKLCDQIADRILDKALEKDPMSRVACEVCAFTGSVIVFGEITTETYIDVKSVVRETVRDIGYTDAASGIDPDGCSVLVNIDEQSPDISGGVTNSLEAREGSGEEEDRLGAGDQGMMFGYATNETDEYMPLPVYLAHKLTKKLTEVRKTGVLPYLRPDGKSQVTVAYENGVPAYVDTIVISTQHDESIGLKELQEDVLREVVKAAVDGKWLNEKTKYLINPSGRFVLGGPAGDSGLTGRKIIVDTYGGFIPHGGGAFSGKDPTKVDRSATYYARYVCKNLVAAGVADSVELQVAYAIGKANPVSLDVKAKGSKLSNAEITEIIGKVFDFRPYSIIRQLGLRQPLYAKTTNYGHFGKPDLPWEKTDRAEEIKKYL